MWNTPLTSLLDSGVSRLTALLDLRRFLSTRYISSFGTVIIFLPLDWVEYGSAIPERSIDRYAVSSVLAYHTYVIRRCYNLGTPFFFSFCTRTAHIIVCCRYEAYYMLFCYWWRDVAKHCVRCNTSTRLLLKPIDRVPSHRPHSTTLHPTVEHMPRNLER